MIIKKYTSVGLWAGNPNGHNGPTFAWDNRLWYHHKPICELLYVDRSKHVRRRDKDEVSL